MNLRLDCLVQIWILSGSRQRQEHIQNCGDTSIMNFIMRRVVDVTRNIMELY